MIKFIDLFAGVGGFRYGIEACNNIKEAQGKRDKGPRTNSSDPDRESRTLRGSKPAFSCVYSNEWNKYASSIYKKHYGECDARDITTVSSSEIPDHDLLVGGFPCQAFSIAGKRGGFNDTRGTLFFEVARILRDKKPKYFILENVKGLLSHDQGRTIQTIFGVLSDLGYDFQWQVLNSKNFGVPQNRERIFIVGNLRGTSRPKVFPITGTGGEDNRNVGEDLSYALDANYHKGTNTLSKGRRQLIQKIGGSQGMRVYDPAGLSTTIAGLAGGWGAKTGLYAMQWRRTEKGKEARRANQKQGHDYTPFGDGHRELVPIEGKPIGTITSQAVAKDSLVGNTTQIRRLTPTECERLQGFPDGWTEGISDTQRYKCLGNAVTTNVVSAVAERLFSSVILT